MRKTEDPFADELGDLDFSINIAESSENAKESEAGYAQPQGWQPVGSTNVEETKGEAFQYNIATPNAASMSSEQFKHLNEVGMVDTLFSTALNPVACLFHLLFKGSSIFSFMFLNAFLGEDILTFIIVVVLAAADFWTVKNITGRLLVNLRWDSHIDQWGNEIYVYESDESRKQEQAAALAGDVEAQDRLNHAQRARVGATDSYVFWTGTYGTPVVWFLLFFMQLIRFSFFWMVTAGVCLSLSFTNAQGYYYCQRSHTAKLYDYIQERGMTMFKDATKSSLMPSFLANMSLPSFLSGRGGGSGNQP